MRRLLIGSKRRVLIASDYLERPVERPHDKVDRTRPIANGSRPLVPGREVVSRNRNERSDFSGVDTGNRPRTVRDRSRTFRKRVVWTQP